MGKTAFSDRLVQAMSDAGLKQADVVRLAQESGFKLGKSAVSQYVSGKTVPRAGVMGELAKILGVSAEWLAAGDSERCRDESDACTTVESELNQSSSSAMQADAQESAGDSAPHGSAPQKPILQTGIPSPIVTKGPIMREFKKSSKLDNVLYDVRGPVVEEANRMEEAGMNILKLNIGNPAPFGFRTPDEVVTDMARQLVDCEGYSASKGLFAARKAIMQYSQIKGLPNVGMDDIFTGNGVSELINICMSALLDDGDEILIPSPDYPLWTACATMAGGNVVHYICDEKADWYPDLDDIRKKVTDRTKAIVIINPNNPTGALYPREILEGIVEIAREHQLIIFSDEIYDRLVMDGLEHTSIASLAPDLFCVTFSGLSKSHMIAGYRIGWMVLSGNKRAAGDYIEGLNMLSNMRLCSNVPAQSVVQTALWGHQSVKSYVVPGGRIFEQRNYIWEALNSIDGVSAVKPRAAFYIFPKLDREKFNITDDDKFALDLLKEKKVLIVSGKGFNYPEPGYFRVVYLPRIEVLQEAMEKLADFLKYYRQ